MSHHLLNKDVLRKYERSGAKAVASNSRSSKTSASMELAATPILKCKKLLVKQDSKLDEQEEEEEVEEEVMETALEYQPVCKTRPNMDEILSKNVRDLHHILRTPTSNEDIPRSRWSSKTVFPTAR